MSDLEHTTIMRRSRRMFGTTPAYVHPASDGGVVGGVDLRRRCASTRPMSGSGRCGRRSPDQRRFRDELAAPAPTGNRHDVARPLPLGHAVPVSRLLIVHHTPSPGMQALLEAARDGARSAAAEAPVEIEVRPALGATVPDVLAADAYLLGTPANIGTMSGALKHFFDTVYYPVLEATRGRRYGLYVHGNSDTTGAVRAVESIASGLGWRAVRPAVTVLGQPGREDLAAIADLGGLAALAAAGATR